MYLPFEDIAFDSPQEPAGSAIFLRLPLAVKKTFAAKARAEGLSVTRLLNEIIGGYMAAQEQPFPQKKKTGRGNIDQMQLEKIKELLRARHPQGVRSVDVARYVGCTSARAMGLLDILSGGSDGRKHDFMVFEDDFAKPPLFYIAKDI